MNHLGKFLFSVFFYKANAIEQQKCQSDSSKPRKLVETVRVYADYIDTAVQSPLRRAFHCSFEYKDYLYVVGGFSFSPQPVSFVSRLSLANTSAPAWEHLIDRKPSTVVNRSNRRFFGEPSFTSIKLDLPRPRYAHACVLDRDNVHAYYFPPNDEFITLD